MVRQESQGNRDGTQGRPARITASEASRRGAGQLAELLGRPPDSVSALKGVKEGWSLAVEIMEIERVPDTASVMATYRVDLDRRGRLLGYERVRRYSRGQIDHQ